MAAEEDPVRSPTRLESTGWLSGAAGRLAQRGGKPSAPSGRSLLPDTLDDADIEAQSIHPGLFLADETDVLDAEAEFFSAIQRDSSEVLEAYTASARLRAAAKGDTSSPFLSGPVQLCNPETIQRRRGPGSGASDTTSDEVCNNTCPKFEDVDADEDDVDPDVDEDVDADADVDAVVNEVDCSLDAQCNNIPNIFSSMLNIDHANLVPLEQEPSSTGAGDVNCDSERSALLATDPSVAVEVLKRLPFPDIPAFLQVCSTWATAATKVLELRYEGDGAGVPHLLCDGREWVSSLLQVLPRFINLKLLSFQGISGISPKHFHQLGAICSNFKSLESLNLSDCKGVSDEALEALVSMSCTTSTLVPSGGSPPPAPPPPPLSSLLSSAPPSSSSWSGLTSLSLACSLTLTDIGVGHIARNMTSLRSLDLDHAAPFKMTVPVPPSEDYSSKSSKSSIKDGDMFGDCVWSDETISDGGVSVIAKHLPRLEALGLTGSLVGDVGLLTLAVQCASLHELRLEACPNVSDAGMGALATGAKKLRRVQLCKRTCVTDAGVQLLSAAHKLHGGDPCVVVR
mmetsp:Transcript_36285/g.43832  ORF Transcript_36285/g.43832 Transcript_36285/m.43832 type:complete len:569 (-) Transcript_36285:646-2352(-)|eukprot:CAMPEP_0197853186 /NCGR_PEP_ID=MMETSP1438-20131217/22255_1 /TAXON_ID=1461541 /ORGANISM="Pterosperma sp., Strain CCMP1384" /LENGTH=568 /DNA_ID=CAMNT_0043467497 /DNA_START=516 /DNA_END=2222 /DNA_ORIENTATION=+